MNRITALISGLLLFAAFLALGRSTIGYEIVFLPPWNNSSPGELHFWLSSVIFLTPAGILLGYAAAPQLKPCTTSLWNKIQNLDSKEKTAAMFLLFALFLLVVSVGRTLILRNLPVTDDEYAARFGGQVLAHGKLLLEKPIGFDAYPDKFFFVTGTQYTAFDWLGIQLHWAIAEITSMGDWAFMILSALTLPAVIYVAAKHLSPGHGGLAAALWLLSPMALSLSFTTHAHLVSRGLFALALAGYMKAESSQRIVWWILTGFLLAWAGITRPAEIVLLSTPLASAKIIDAIKNVPGARRAVLAIAVGALAPLAMFLLHNMALTGNPLTPARFAGSEHIIGASTEPGSAGSTFFQTIIRRFANNTSYNTLMLILFFLGPVGICMAIAGINRDRFTRMLSIGIGLNLALAVFHGDYGLHIVGPIHYSETAVPLTILAVAGFDKIATFIKSQGISKSWFASLLIVFLLVSLIPFSTWHLRSLYRQASMQESVYNQFSDSSFDNSVVIAPQYYHLWATDPEHSQIRSFVFDWRRVTPDASERVVFLHDHPEVISALRTRFSDRRLFIILPVKTNGYVKLLPRPTDLEKLTRRYSRKRPRKENAVDPPPAAE